MRIGRRLKEALRPVLVLAIFQCAIFVSSATAQVSFTSSDLPIVVIETGGRPIPNEPKITAEMGIIDNGEGRRNHIGDPFNGYSGLIGIEIRGSSSQMFPKKQYAVETREEDGSNRNVPLLGLPAENDWILHAPYSDKSLMRNALTYHVARRMGRYASRTRWCEVVINGDYRGLYILMEKIKRDKSRVDVSRLDPDEIAGDDLTGGYILKIDKWDGANNDGWESAHPPPAAPDRRIAYQYHYPDPSDIAPEQKAYIRGYIREFEDMMAGPEFAHPERGYRARLDVASFVDYLIVNELGRNVDGYRLSAFMYKDRDSKNGRLVMGPAWDFNLAFGNADYYDGSNTAGFQIEFSELGDNFQIPFWWGRLLQDTVFGLAVAQRWRELRQDVLSTDSLLTFVEETAVYIDEARRRNFQRWPVLGQYVWPNKFVGATYEQEVKYLKDWILDRVAWLDANIDLVSVRREEEVPFMPQGYSLSQPYPNPTKGTFRSTLRVLAEQQVVADVYDAIGRRRTRLIDAVLSAGTEHTLYVDAAALPAGVYFIRIRGRDFTATRSVILY